jgi:Fur family transcriptional regulator, ferric uptake regulator
MESEKQHASPNEQRAEVLVKHIYSVLDQVSQRHTRPRHLIVQHLKKLAASGADFAVDDVWRELRKDTPHLGRTTLYRTIELLVSHGILDRIDFADGTHRYRVCGGKDHYHLTCSTCHRVIEVHVPLPLEQFNAVSKQANFAFEEVSLTLFGQCANCQVR